MKKKKVLKQIKNNASYVSAMLNVVGILEERVSALEGKDKEEEPNLEITKEWVEDYIKACEGEINGKTVKFGDSVVDDTIRESNEKYDAHKMLKVEILLTHVEEGTDQPITTEMVFACMDEYHKQMMGLICQ